MTSNDNQEMSVRTINKYLLPCVECKWTLNKVPNADTEIESPRFQIGPGGEDVVGLALKYHKDDGCLEFNLRALNSRPFIFASYALSILDPVTGAVLHKSKEHKCRYQGGTSWTQLYTKTSLVDHNQTKTMVSLNFLRGVKFCTGHPLVLLFEAIYPPSLDSLQMNTAALIDTSISDDFGNLLKTGKNSDFTLVAIDGTEFAVHKIILLARSRVFAAMLDPRTDSLELRTGRVETLLEPQIVSLFLSFLYTGRFPVDEKKQDQTTVMALLSAADLYELNALKTSCAGWLSCSLSLENACDLLLLADSRHVEVLKRDAIAFIRYNRQQLAKTDGWQRFAGDSQNFNLLKEMFLS